MSDYPEDLKYTSDHEWTRIEGTTARIGITRFAVEQLGDVTLVELPAEGDPVERGRVFGTVESVKAVSDLYAPLTGKVLRVNSPLNDSPEYVNQDPYDEGWMIEIEITEPDQIAELMDPAAYTAFVAEQD